jgi:hypothetical protein
MVLSVLKGLGKAYLKNKAKTIKSVAPFSKTGGKTVKEWKSKVQHKKYLDAIRDAGHEITGNLKKSAEKLKKLNETLKKQKKILDD